MTHQIPSKRRLELAPEERAAHRLAPVVSEEEVLEAIVDLLVYVYR